MRKSHPTAHAWHERHATVYRELAAEISEVCCTCVQGVSTLNRGYSLVGLL